MRAQLLEAAGDKPHALTFPSAGSALRSVPEGQGAGWSAGSVGAQVQGGPQAVEWALGPGLGGASSVGGLGTGIMSCGHWVALEGAMLASRSAHLLLNSRHEDEACAAPPHEAAQGHQGV